LTKKKKRKNQKRGFSLTLFFLLMLLLLVIGGSGFVFYKLGYENGYKKAYNIARAKLSRLTREKKAIQNHLKNLLSEVEDYKKNISSFEKEEEKFLAEKKKLKQAIFFQKPKLAIIIDDIAFGYQIRKLKKVGLPLTLSFFPPSKIHPKTPQYAKKLPFYMIHLPMEAKNFFSTEEHTLTVNMSEREIEQYIRHLRNIFPKAKFINNHTGSRFTSDLNAMERLIGILRKYNFTFVDSRTTPETKMPQIAKELNITYLGRDIFLDNKQTVSYIKGQLKKAVKIAKKRGYAIAIGHPHPKTIEALKSSKNILKSVKVVYIGKLL
jgi:polysaccharide deacetylase 2 family uncharacterized protein YibQ